jgi:hypothetical protein
MYNAQVKITNYLVKIGIEPLEYAKILRGQILENKNFEEIL